MTSLPHDGYWQTGGRLIRFALLVPLIVGLLLGTFLASVAAGSRATGLDAENRGWFFLMVPPVQLVGSVGATVYMASLFFGRTALPRLAGAGVSAWATAVMGSRGTVEDLGGPRNVLTALGLAVGGTVAVLLVVPVQVILTTWLIMRPDLYSDVEKVVIGVETAAVAVWLAYLGRGLWSSRRAASDPARSKNTAS